MRDAKAPAGDYRDGAPNIDWTEVQCRADASVGVLHGKKARDAAGGRAEARLAPLTRELM